MNFEQFVNNLKIWASENEVNLDDIHVSHGGSCMMLGIKLNTDDIDLTVTEKIFNRFDDPERRIDLGDGRYLIQVTPNIDIHLAEDDIARPCLIQHESGIWYRDTQRTLFDYQKLNRPKDQHYIQLLTQLREEELNDPDAV